MAALLSMKNIKKSFSGVAALKNAELELNKGEVLALMGENGAGKSTLMKILTGIYAKDEGTIQFEGKEVEYKTVSESEEAGIAIVHQELNMMNDLTVAQNLFIGQERMNGFFIDDRKMEKDAAALFEKLNVDIEPGAKIGDLTVGKQQMVEIAKAISADAKVIVFDEPSAALSQSEIEELFKVIRDLRAKGTGIIYISHRMDEINVISDRVTVMRDGEYVGTLITKDCTKDDIIKLMVGRTVFMEPKTASSVKQDAEVVLKCEHLSRGKAVKDVSFELRKGEILGFSGLMEPAEPKWQGFSLEPTPWTKARSMFMGRKWRFALPRTQSKPVSAIFQRTGRDTVCWWTSRWKKIPASHRSINSQTASSLMRENVGKRAKSMCRN